MIGFLSAVLRMSKEDLENLQILNNEITKDYQEERKGILDVRVRTREGKQIDIEVQVLPLKMMEERTLFYWSKMYTSQIEAGDDYTKLKKCITINVVDFIVTPLKKLNSVYHIFEDETGYKLTDVLEIHFLELPKLLDPEIPRDEDDPVVMWMEFIDGKREVIEMLSKKNEDINYAYNLLKIISQDKKARMEYEARIAALRDEATRLKIAREEGKIEGKKEVAKKMLLNGLDITTVAEMTDMTISEVEKIKEEILQ